MAREKDKETIEFFPDRPSQVPPPPDPPDPALDKALKDTFPASDPPANVQPRHDEDVVAAEDAARDREAQEKRQGPGKQRTS